MNIQPVTIDDLVRAIQVSHEAVVRWNCARGSFTVGAMAILRAFGPDKGNVLNHRLLLANDLALRPMLKKAWTRVNNGQEEISAALLYAAATIPYTSYKISSREVHRLANQYCLDNDYESDK